MSEGPQIRRRRFQFGLGTLLLASVLMGAGIGCFIVGFRHMDARDGHDLVWEDVFAILQILGAGPLIGAALFMPFSRARLGSYVGFLALIVLAFGRDINRGGLRMIWQSTSTMIVFGLTAFAVALVGYGAVRGIWQR